MFACSINAHRLKRNITGTKRARKPVNSIHRYMKGTHTSPTTFQVSVLTESASEKKTTPALQRIKSGVSLPSLYFGGAFVSSETRSGSSAG